MSVVHRWARARGKAARPEWTDVAPGGVRPYAGEQEKGWWGKKSAVPPAPAPQVGMGSGGTAMRSVAIPYQMSGTGAVSE